MRFLTGLLKQRSGVLDDGWKGKVTPMVRHLSRTPRASADMQVERVREIGRNAVGVEDSHPVSWARIAVANIQTKTRVLASSTLAALTANISGDLLNTALRSEKALGKTIKAVLPEITSLGERFDLVESGLVRVPDTSGLTLASDTSRRLYRYRLRTKRSSRDRPHHHCIPTRPG